MDNEIIEVKQADMLTAINRAEVDMQISTAKQYPRDTDAVLQKIRKYATMDTVSYTHLTLPTTSRV